ncbi:ZIP family metal transporter [Microcella pacifica]|uniref:ZIP family metal transporter n=1 Tax=Microcella pacifica TaxID=2591847 RepID=A0A9E5MI73_9MICO|nr:ZIP family metal transporter [Microcella pacifica]NHF63260.1 ZIP family metal transporter [Microcella pacifica]
MNDFLLVLGLAALPAVGTMLGGLAAEVVGVSGRRLSLALHFATGIVLAVVGLELMREALRASAPWITIAAFALGGLGFLGIERSLAYVKRRFGSGEVDTGPSAIFAGVSIDLFSDGVMIGTGTVINPGLGLILALGQVPADIPEGFAAIATLRRSGVGRRTRLILSFSFAIPVLVGATIGYLALRSAPEIITLSVLAFTGGLLTSMAVEEMTTQAHQERSSRLEPFFLTAGFALFALISAYVG